MNEEKKCHELRESIIMMKINKSDIEEGKGIKINAVIKQNEITNNNL